MSLSAACHSSSQPAGRGALGAGCGVAASRGGGAARRGAHRGGVAHARPSAPAARRRTYCHRAQYEREAGGGGGGREQRLHRRSLALALAAHAARPGARRGWVALLWVAGRARGFRLFLEPNARERAHIPLPSRGTLQIADWVTPVSRPRSHGRGRGVEAVVGRAGQGAAGAGAGRRGHRGAAGQRAGGRRALAACRGRLRAACSAPPRRRPPLQCITNFVSMDIMANVLLAAGASPAMAHALDEVRAPPCAAAGRRRAAAAVRAAPAPGLRAAQPLPPAPRSHPSPPNPAPRQVEDFVGISSALLINMGTLSADWIAAKKLVRSGARGGHGHPAQTWRAALHLPVHAPALSPFARPTPARRRRRGPSRSVSPGCWTPSAAARRRTAPRRALRCSS
jgi:hypothetical protein